jgi:hypothetical protein
MPVATENAEEGRLTVVDVEPFTETLVVGDGFPVLADTGGVHAVGRLRGDTEKDVAKEVVIFERMHPGQQR